MLIHGNNLDELPKLADASIDAIITDPPYELGFMGKSWDSTGIAYNVQLWRECLRVLKPGGHLLAFSGSRTYHRMAVAIEDAGFEIRDQIMWVYGSGFPKSLDVSKAIDKQAGAQREVVGQGRAGKNALGQDSGWNKTYEPDKYDLTVPATDAAKQWAGWGTALKPAHEPIVLARKPLDGTVANNVLQHGTGALNIDACRVATDDAFGGGAKATSGFVKGYENDGWTPGSSLGRWPANLIHDGSDEVLELFPHTTSGAHTKDSEWAESSTETPSSFVRGMSGKTRTYRSVASSGSAARFFYCAKANKRDRNEGLDDFTPTMRKTMSGGEWIDSDGTVKNRPQSTANTHPTVKPTELMRYLCRLITPPGGTILDPFSGSGSTGKAAILERFNFIGIELDPDYITIAQARIDHAYTQRH